MIVEFVKEYSRLKNFWKSTYETIPKTDPTNVPSVLKASNNLATLVSTWEPTQMNVHFYAMFVVKHSSNHVSSNSTWGFIPEKSPISVQSVIGDSNRQVSWTNTSDCTQEKSHTSVWYVVRPLLRQANYDHTRKPTNQNQRERVQATNLKVRFFHMSTCLNQLQVLCSHHLSQKEGFTILLPV